MSLPVVPSPYPKTSLETRYEQEKAKLGDPITPILVWQVRW